MPTAAKAMVNTWPSSVRGTNVPYPTVVIRVKAKKREPAGDHESVLRVGGDWRQLDW
jgi:hypothetical protein